MVICFMLFLSAGLCAGIISAISVDLFPTNYRAMATCLILMLGRFGAVGGSNFVSSLLHRNCELMFYVYSGLILSECAPTAGPFPRIFSLSRRFFQAPSLFASS